jgi:hypothetical protein
MKSTASQFNEIERRILETIAEALPAERGAILLWDSTHDEFSSEVSWSRGEKNPTQKHSMRVSRTAKNMGS